MINFLNGAISMAAAVAALVFLSFYRRTGDRLFIYFCTSFGIESVARLLFVMLHWNEQDNPAFYFLRLVAYGLIVAAIVDKNLAGRRGS